MDTQSVEVDGGLCAISLKGRFYLGNTHFNYSLLVCSQPFVLVSVSVSFSVAVSSEISPLVNLILTLPVERALSLSSVTIVSEEESSSMKEFGECILC